MEKYSFILTPSNKKSIIDFAELENKYRIFTSASENCNSGITFSRSGKKITLKKIEPNQITLVLSAISPLSSPTRTLSAFSREIIKLNEKYNCLTDAIYNHTLFNTRLEAVKKEITTIKEMTDAELIVSITNLIFSPSSYEPIRRENTINRLKEIMLPYIIQQ